MYEHQFDPLDQPFYSDNELEETVLPSFIGREGGTLLLHYVIRHPKIKHREKDAPIEEIHMDVIMLKCIVTNATTDFFEIQTSGMVEFDLPHYENTLPKQQMMEHQLY